jgi:putative Holliday junction resolvase
MGRVLGLDLGDARVGLAISDDLKRLARGLSTVRGKERHRIFSILGEMIGQFEVEEIVVGLPKNMDGSLGRQAEKALAFAEALKKQFGVSVTTWDERLTTVAAKRALIDSGTRRSGRGREAIDRVSAILILQGYLDSLFLQGAANHKEQG